MASSLLWPRPNCAGLAWETAVYLFFAGMDYRKLREWNWILYGGMIVLLVGLFFAPAIQNVHRWYKIPLIGFAFQPSEYAKLVVVVALSAFLEQRGERKNGPLFNPF